MQESVVWGCGEATPVRGMWDEGLGQGVHGTGCGEAGWEAEAEGKPDAGDCGE